MPLRGMPLRGAAFQVRVDALRDTKLSSRLSSLEGHIRREPEGTRREQMLALFLSIRRDIEEGVQDAR